MVCVRELLWSPHIARVRSSHLSPLSITDFAERVRIGADLASRLSDLVSLTNTLMPSLAHSFAPSKQADKPTSSQASSQVDKLATQGHHETPMLWWQQLAMLGSSSTSQGHQSVDEHERNHGDSGANGRCCELCCEDFASAVDLDAHERDHVPCLVPDCAFVASKVFVNHHYLATHAPPDVGGGHSESYDARQPQQPSVNSRVSQPHASSYLTATLSATIAGV